MELEIYPLALHCDIAGHLYYKQKLPIRLLAYDHSLHGLAFFTEVFSNLAHVAQYLTYDFVTLHSLFEFDHYERTGIHFLSQDVNYADASRNLPASHVLLRIEIKLELLCENHVKVRDNKIIQVLF